MEMRAIRRRQHKNRRWIIGILLALIGIFVVGYSIIGTALRPINQANREYSALAIKKKQVVSVNTFYWNSRDHTYYTVVGINKKHQPVAVIIEKHTKKMQTVKLADGISYEAVKKQIKTKYQPKRITNIGMAIYKTVPVWEVTFIDQNGNLNFITVQFSNGNEVRTIQNL
ncbi:MAG: DUF5590 domain-containing protein [Lactobacillaceae bacterium]|jgi:uncharacterized protein YpmB|nr:DUF5590 domain-containing protein [Lactobacillaceae bacterium]